MLPLLGLSFHLILAIHFTPCHWGLNLDLNDIRSTSIHISEPKNYLMLILVIYKYFYVNPFQCRTPTMYVNPENYRVETKINFKCHGTILLLFY